MDNRVLIYTDGSCDINPGGNGGFSSIIFIDENPIFLSGCDSNTTNQRMEMRAVIQAFEYLYSLIEKDKEIILFTDSAYVCNCFIQKWYKNWIKNGWKTSTGSDVQNQDLWKKMLVYTDHFINLKFCKVKGHADNIFNNKCDEMAKSIVSFKKEINKKINRGN